MVFGLRHFSAANPLIYVQRTLLLAHGFDYGGGEQNGVLWSRHMTDTSSSTGAAKPRPLSPHLSIYKPIPTMVMSILHRITGAALYFGTILVAWWLIAAASGPAAYDTASWFFGTIIGRLILFGYTWALMHHMLGGLKHLVQDTGSALEKNFTTRMAMLQPIASITLTILIWVMGYSVR